jgi:hypothetical protein
MFSIYLSLRKLTTMTKPISPRQLKRGSWSVRSNLDAKEVINKGKHQEYLKDDEKVFSISFEAQYAGDTSYKKGLHGSFVKLIGDGYLVQVVPCGGTEARVWEPGAGPHIFQEIKISRPKSE